MSGHVYLVGAGPGDPGLITVKGADCLRRADHVLYDRLVHPSLLSYPPETAVLEYVGKEVGTPSAPRQEAINRRLVELGLAGHQVVRLKGGDPFVFGRGSEEAMALTEAGVPWTVVPGVTSAVAAPALAGIPVTHRGVSNSFAVFAGREGEPNSLDPVNWALASQMTTSVFLMGVGQLPMIVERLLSGGKPTDTPVAVVCSGSLETQVTFVGTLHDIVERARDATPPAVVVVGPTVLLRDQLGGRS